MPQKSSAKKPSAVILTTYQGHQSIAESIEETLKERYEVFTYTDDNFIFPFYVFVYRFFPSVTAKPFAVFEDPYLRKIADNFLYIQYQRKIKKFINMHKPSLVVNAFWMFRPTLDRYLKNNKIKYLNIITDPLTVHPFLGSQIADDNLAFDQETVNVVQNHLENKGNVSATGWFVRDRFEENFDKKSVRKKLKLNQDALTFLFSTGSEGTEVIIPIIEELVARKKKVQIVVACGTNTHLLEMINEIKKRANNNTLLHAIPFTKEIQRYMQAADLVIGKAGPNSVFEAVATLTPFFATTHIAGQEDGNLEIIKNKKLGYVEEDSEKATRLLLNIIDHPNQLKEFISPLQKLADYNKSSGEKLLSIIDDIEK